jgi:hypothetical protein
LACPREQARDAVRARLGAVAKGIDPRAERVRRRSEAERERAEVALTFDGLIEEWKALHLAHCTGRFSTQSPLSGHWPAPLEPARFLPFPICPRRTD